MKKQNHLTRRKFIRTTSAGAIVASQLVPAYALQVTTGNQENWRRWVEHPLEGINLSPYIKNGLHKEPWVDNILGRNVYKKMYTPQRLQQFKEEMACPNCDIVCEEEMVMLWASGPLLGTRDDMDDIINALTKVYENRHELNKI